MRKAKVHTVESIKKDFTGRSISRRTAKIRLAMVHPGDDPKTKATRSSIMSGLIRDKQGVNKKKKAA